MADRHDKMAEAMTRFVGNLTGHWGTHSNQLELAADLRRIEEEEKLQSVEPEPPTGAVNIDADDGECISAGGLAVELGLYKQPASEGETLLPCPFCGGVNLVKENVVGTQALKYVRCRDCDAEGPLEQSDTEPEGWNTRAKPCTCNVDAAVRDSTPLSTSPTGAK